jgi:hypothetical protein
MERGGERWMDPEGKEAVGENETKAGQINIMREGKRGGDMNLTPGE